MDKKYIREILRKIKKTNIKYSLKSHILLHQQNSYFIINYIREVPSLRKYQQLYMLWNLNFDFPDEIQMTRLNLL